MTKYVLVFLIKGKANKYQQSLTKELSRKFKIENVSNRVAPHITLKFIGEVKSKNKINELESFLSDFVKNEQKIKINLKGINHFRKDVIFIDVKQTKKLVDFYQRLYSGLKDLKWMPIIKKFEGKNMHFHATLAVGDIRGKYYKIKKYLADRNPDYSLFFDNLTLIKKKGKKWVNHKKFNLK